MNQSFSSLKPKAGQGAEMPTWSRNNVLLFNEIPLK